MKFKSLLENTKKVIDSIRYRCIKIFKKANNIYSEETTTFKKLTGFDYTDILSQWVSTKYLYDHIIVLMNINVEAKNIQFWAKIPQTEIEHFLKDIVILRCKDQTQLIRLIENIPVEFAEAYGYSGGCLITYNREDYE
jgi:predicted transcriptional regulator